ncbi:hypothetical protein GCM10022410_25440 [Amphibacillus indicireducens]|uniref:Uncharacterized protein n=1 Tax=Amphibacillus indicireducens TaxID=1076330 RepID=A0ABP7W4Z8_9BACI
MFFEKYNRYEAFEGRRLVPDSIARQKAIDEYREFNKYQKIVSDFDREIKKIQGEQT